MEHQSLTYRKTPEKKKIVKPKPEKTRISETAVVNALKRIEEQMVVLNDNRVDVEALRQEIGSLHMKFDVLLEELAKYIAFHLSLDKEEKELMDLLKAKMK